MDFNHYFTNEELEELFPAWVQQYPHLVSLNRIGESYEKRPLWLLAITNAATGPDTDKPAVWIDANIHATEIAGTTTALLIAHTLLSRHGQDEQVTRLLDEGVYYIAPRLNPDGAALAMAERPRYIRSGVRLYPFEDKDEGLHEEDIDGDGRILMMRIPDPNGGWKVSTLNPRLMEKRLPDEWGSEYYRLLPEGRIEDWDGDLIRIARPEQGLDFNRNFPFQWRPEGEERGAGPYPVSEPEIRAVVDFITSHPNINFGLTYHTFSRVILRPYSTKADDEMDTDDLWVFKAIGERGTELTGYRNLSTFHDFKYHPKEVTTGAFDDWLYDQFGIFTFTIEQWDLPTEAGIKERKFSEWFRQHPHKDDLQILQWAEEHTGSSGYVDWYPYEHPQLGRVELGGWDLMYTWRNPPAAWMGAEAARNLPFALSVGDMLPRLSLHKLEIQPLQGSQAAPASPAPGPGSPRVEAGGASPQTTPGMAGSGSPDPASGGLRDYRLHLVVENRGYLPTYTSAQGKKSATNRPVRVELELPEGARLVSGKRRLELGHLEGRSTGFLVTEIWLAEGTDHRARAEWLVRAPAGTQIKLNILSERAGNIRRSITLE
jgi:murein tripeptide amidase MpaA